MHVEVAVTQAKTQQVTRNLNQNEDSEREPYSKPVRTLAKISSQDLGRDLLCQPIIFYPDCSHHYRNTTIVAALAAETE